MDVADDNNSCRDFVLKRLGSRARYAAALCLGPTKIPWYGRVA